MDKIFGNIAVAFNSEQDNGDAAGFIDEILFIVGVALAAVAISGWIGGAAMNKGSDIASCIEGMNTTVTTAASANCGASATSNSATKSFKKDANYTARYGTTP